MKRFLLFVFLLTALSQWSCTDRCEQTRTYKRFVPVTVTLADIRKGIKTETGRQLESPAKIYSKGNFLFINELKKGIHIIDNSNPAAPRIVAFVNIPGNGDMAVRGDILYADSYMDLVALNISNPLNIKEVGRVTDVFPRGQFDGASWFYNGASSVSLSDQKLEIVTETLKTDCDGGNYNVWRGDWITFVGVQSSFSSDASKSSNTGPTSGQAGSMARFALYDNYLYTINQNEMQLFDIKTLEKPVQGAKISMNWGIETIFPYKDKLFIGSTTGMHIYDNANPAQPVKLSTFSHVTSCDPVVVEGNTAYVTLRTGNNCNRGVNVLDVLDVTDLRNPTLIKSYPMQNPHGLGVDFPNLFICEGTNGLKSLDVSQTMDVKQLQQINNMNAYDVIPLAGKHLLMVGKDGLYQFDYSNPSQLRQISVIPVKRIEI